VSDSPKFQTLTAIWNLRDDRSLSAGEHRTLTALSSYANAKGQCCPSVAALAATARMGKPAVRAAIQALERRNGPIRVRVVRDRKTANGDAAAHAYTLSPGVGWLEQVPVGDQLVTKMWDGQGWVDRVPRVRAESTHGYVLNQPTVGRSGTEGREQNTGGVGNETVGGGSIQHHKEETKRTVEEENKKERSGTLGQAQAGARDLQALAAAYLRDEFTGRNGGIGGGVASAWPEVLAVCAAFQAAWSNPVTLRAGLKDPRLKVILERFADGCTVEQLEQAIRRSRFADYIANNQANQTLQTILRDIGQVEKFGALTGPPNVPKPQLRRGEASPDEERRITRNNLIDDAKLGRYGSKAKAWAESGKNLSDLADKLEQKRAQPAPAVLQLVSGIGRP
jgi:hypothetical protein